MTHVDPENHSPTSVTNARPAVKVYVTRICAYCTLAKRLLRSKGVEFEELDVSGDASARMWLVETTGQRTVPQVFIDDKPYGGYTDIAQLDQQGRLDGLLGLDPGKP